MRSPRRARPTSSTSRARAPRTKTCAKPGSSERGGSSPRPTRTPTTSTSRSRRGTRGPSC
jgi:hypothetical protein